MKKIIKILLILSGIFSYASAEISGDFSNSKGAIYRSQRSDMAYDIKVDTITSEGPFVYVLGYTLPEDNSFASYYILKYDLQGNLVSSAPLYNASTFNKIALKPQALSDIFVAGSSNFGGFNKLVVGKYANDLSSTSFQLVSYSSAVFPYSVSPLEMALDNNYVYILANTNTGCKIIRLNSDFSLPTSHVYPQDESWNGVSCYDMKLMNGYLYGIAYDQEIGRVLFKISSDLSSEPSYTLLSQDEYPGDTFRLAVSADNIFVVNGYKQMDPVSKRTNLILLTGKYDSNLSPVAISSPPFVEPNWGILVDADIDEYGNLAVVSRVHNGFNEDYKLYVFDSSSLILKKSFIMDSGKNDIPSALAIDNSSNVYVTGQIYVYEPLAYTDRPDISTVKFDLKENVNINREPFLSWASTENYWSDGLDPEAGIEGETFTYKVKYQDPDNDAPSYVKVNVYKDGNLLRQIDMNFESWIDKESDYRAGVIYSTSMKLNSGNYSYKFEAYDVKGTTAIGSPVSEMKGPFVQKGFEGNVASSDGASFSNGFKIEPVKLSIYRDSNDGDYFWGFINQNGSNFILKFSTGTNSNSNVVPVKDEIISPHINEFTNDEAENIYVLRTYFAQGQSTSVLHKFDKNLTFVSSFTFDNNIDPQDDEDDKEGLQLLKYHNGTLYSLFGPRIVEYSTSDINTYSIIPVSETDFDNLVDQLGENVVYNMRFRAIDYANDKLYLLADSSESGMPGVMLLSLSKDTDNNEYNISNYDFFKPFEVGNIEAKALAIDADGKIFIGANINNGQNNNFLILKYQEENGFNLLSSKIYDAGNTEELKDIKVSTTTGDVYVTGIADVKTSFNNTVRKLIVLKFDNDLNFKSNYIYGNDFEENGGISLALNSNSEPYVFGYTQNTVGERKVRVIKPVLSENLAQLTINVRKNDNTPLKDVNVVVIPFKDGKTDISFIYSGVTDSNGRVNFNVKKNVSYFIALSTPGYTPAIVDQIFDPYGRFIQEIKDNTSLSYTLYSDPQPKNTVKVQVSNVYKDLPVLAEIYLLKNREKVAYGFLKATDTVSTIEIHNVPQLSAGSYGIEISVPDWLSVNLTPQTPIPSAEIFEVSMSSALPPSVSYVKPSEPSSVYLSGIVTDDKGNVLKNARIKVIYKCYDNNKFVDCGEQQTFSDSGGKFSLSNLINTEATNIELKISRQGYKAISGWISVSNLPLLNQTYQLSPANYSISGVIKYNGNALGNTKVTIRGDERGDYIGDDSYTGWNKSAQIDDIFAYTDGDGYFSIGGLADGNIRLNVEYPVWKSINDGADGRWDTKEDNIRITISSDTAIPPSYPPSNPCLPGKVWVLDSSGTCKGIMPYVFDVGKNETTNAVVSGSIFFTTTYTVTESNPLIIDKSSAVVIGLFEECKGEDCNTKSRFFKTIYGTLTSNTTSYSIEVSSDNGKIYYMDILSNSWAKVNSFDNQIKFENTNHITRDIKLTPAGRLIGYLRKPDGSIYKHQGGGSPHIRIRGENVSFDKGANFDNDSGMFEFPNIVPGSYKLTVSVSTNTSYAPVELTGIVVNAGKTTSLNVTLKEGLFVQPQIYGLPADIIRTTEVWHYAVLATPAGEKMDQKYITHLFFSDDPGYVFDYSSTTLQWDKKVMLEGQYDFYLVLAALYCNNGDTRCAYDNYNQFLYFIGSAKNVSIKKDENNPLLGTSTQPIPINILGSIGQNEFKGWVKGNNIFTDSDFERIFANFETEILPLIPSVLVYDSAGVLKAFSHVLPDSPSSLNIFFNGVVNQSTSTIRSVIQNGNMKYYIWGLPPAKYTVVFSNPNYPPVTRNITIPDESEYNFDFDQQNILVGGFKGIVLSSTTLSPLSGASVYVKGKVVDKYAITDSSGEFRISNLPPGSYKIEVSMDGYVKTGKKISVEGSITEPVYFYLQPSSSTIAGRVFLSKFPNPVTKEGIRVTAYDATLNLTKAYIPLIEDFTNENGEYELKGIIPGHKYNISVIEPGKMTSTFTVTAQAGRNIISDIVLLDLPPQIQIKLRKDPDSPRKVNVIIKSPKELLSIPECKYNPGSVYDSSSAVNLALIPGPNNTYMGQFTTSVNSRYYTVKVSVGDVKKLEKTVVYDSISNAKTEQFMYDELFTGGNMYMDREREEYSGLEVDPGAMLQSSTQTIDINDLVGGFFRSLPNIKTTKTEKGNLTISDNIKSIMASEVYNIDLSNVQANKSFTLTLKYDKEKGVNASSLKIYQQDPSGNWKEVPGTYTIDPMLGTISVEVDSIEKAYEGTESQNTPLGRKTHKMTAIVNGEYVPTANINPQSTQQSGVFAVFSAKPDPNIPYSGSSYEVYNFPNPFNLKSKTVTITSEGAPAFGGSTSYQTNGTIIKYHLPAGKSGHIKFVIYNTAGEKVRTLDEGLRDGGKTYYSEWDGKNDKNEECASGVYFLMTYLNGEKLGSKPHKMAIIK